MKTTVRAAGVTGLALALVGLGTATASAATPSSLHHRDGTVFVQTDDLTGNAVVAYHRAADGTLRQKGVHQTGGLGGSLTGSVADHLASQGSLLQDRGLLYAVNAGSDTISTFDVHGDDLNRRQIISSGGYFPVSVTASAAAVYVLNARDGGSVQGYRRSGDRLTLVPGWHRNLGIDPAQTPEFTHTAGQIGFTPDGSGLVVTTKAGANTIDVFGVQRSGGLTADPVVNADAGAVPFGFTFDPQGHLVVSEAGTNSVATFALTRRGTVTLIDRQATGQAATCWVVSTRSTLYASNAGSGSLSAYQVDRHGRLSTLGNTATDAGTVDAAVSADGGYLYVQTGIAGNVDEFRVAADGSLTRIGSVTVPGAIGGQGIVAF